MIETNELGCKDKSSKSSPDFFKKLDSYSLPIRIGKVTLFQLNFFRDDVKFRKALVPLVALFSMLWLVQGFDSSFEQFVIMFAEVPAYLSGKINWEHLVFYYTDAYGKYLHTSSVILYTVFFIGISKYLHEKLEVVNSENITVSITFLAMTVGLFEFFWLFSYNFAQNQTWILQQARIISQNIAFLSIGAITLIGIDWKNLKLNLNKWTLVLATTTFTLMTVWMFYGFILPVETINVPVEGYGIWQSSQYFPQTLYTVDPNVLDGVAKGIHVYVQNDLLHLNNILTKAFMTLTIFNLLKLKKRKTAC